MNLGVLTKDLETAEQEFITIWGSEHTWFLDLFKLVNEIRRVYGIKITDVLIRAGKPIYFGILKNFFTLKQIIGSSNKIDLNQFKRFTETKGKLSLLDIKSFVEKYVTYKFAEKREIKHLNFSLNIYGLGCYRINYSENDEGVSLNIRVLDFEIPSLGSILPKNQYAQRYVDFFNKLIETKEITFERQSVEIGKVKRGGLILHAGPTGSGKTTFIAAELLHFVNNIAGLLITYEDPIEYRFTDYPKVLQIELETNLKEEEVVKHFLRNSPSIGMFHEVKTREQFENVIDLASRGHLVFTTVHANDVGEVFSSFSTLDKNFRQLFSQVLLAIVCHKLDLGNKGEIVPLLEVFFNDAVYVGGDAAKSRAIFTLFLDQDIIKLRNLLYAEKKYEFFWTFQDFKRF